MLQTVEAPGSSFMELAGHYHTNFLGLFWHIKSNEFIRSSCNGGILNVRKCLRDVLVNRPKLGIFLLFPVYSYVVVFFCNRRIAILMYLV